jgi:hypothetical protein
MATSTAVFAGAVSDRDRATSTAIFVGAVSDRDRPTSKLMAVADR